MKNRTAILLAVVAALVLGLAGQARAEHKPPAHPPTFTGARRFVCASGARDEVTQRGRREPSYFVRNAFWNGLGHACLRTDGRPAFTVLHTPRRARDGRVVAFPDISRGCHWGHCTPDDVFPVRVNRIRSMPSYVRTRDARKGTYNRAYDIWFSRHETTYQPTHPDGTEMMIWTGEHGHCCWRPDRMQKVRIDHRWWWRYHTVVYDHSDGHRYGGMHWNYLQYRAVRPHEAMHLNLAAFVRDAQRIRVVHPYWYLECVEYGFEIWSGGHGVGVRDFRVGLTTRRGQ